MRGKYAGSRGDKIFGRLDCQSGLRKLHPENRVFFPDWFEATEAGYRPCKVCRPDVVRLNEVVDVFHPVNEKLHVALWKSGPPPDRKKPSVAWYVAMNWVPSGARIAQKTLNEKWFPYPTAAREALEWGDRLGLVVLRHGIVSSKVLFLPTDRQTWIQRKEVARLRRASDVICM